MCGKRGGKIFQDKIQVCRLITKCQKYDLFQISIKQKFRKNNK